MYKFVESDLEQAALEWFEELGYEIDNTKESIRYFKNSTYIWFWKDNKEFEGIFGFDSKGFNMQELQAINKKVEELGWI